MFSGLLKSNLFKWLFFCFPDFLCETEHAEEEPQGSWRVSSEPPVTVKKKNCHNMHNMAQHKCEVKYRGAHTYAERPRVQEEDWVV